NAGHCADGGSRSPSAELLFNGDGRRHAGNAFCIGFGKVVEESARLMRERFDIASLPFYINGIKGKRRFSRSGNACKNDELPCLQLKIYPLEIVDAHIF